jgi:translation initiation factor IF-2
MAKNKGKTVRIYKLAKELGMSSNDLIDHLQDEGIEVKSHMSSLPTSEALQIKKKIQSGIEEERKEKVKKGKKVEVKEEPKETKKEKKIKAKKKVKQVVAQLEGIGRKKKYKKKEKKEEEKEDNIIPIGEGTSVSELAELIDTPPNEVIGECLNLGLQVTINQRLDFETASLILEEFGFKAELSEGYEVPEVEQERYDIKQRPPIVTVMGHVDHGKTTLLDYIRKTRVADQEKGGITQKIGAYHINYLNHTITFIDTPGHEAFTAMRARGANVTDVVVLVVASNEGVKPQTVEAIDHAKAAGVPIIVAINKIDLASANPDKVRSDLVDKGIIAHEYGGDVLCVEISALKGTGVEELLDAILLLAEDLDLKSPTKGPGLGVILEAKIWKGLGNVATVVVKEGEIKINDSFIAGATCGKVRLIQDENENKLDCAGASSAVLIARFEDLPEVGDNFRVVDDQKIARSLSEVRKSADRKRELVQKKSVSLESLYEQIEEGKIEILKVVIKGDDAGCVEALRDSLEGLSTDEVKIEVIHTGVGEISENDVMLASASNAIVIGYKVHPNSKAKKEAKNHSIEIKTYDVIFEIIDEVKLAMTGLLEPEREEVKTGEAEIRRIFKGSKIGTVAGCYVLSGEIHNKDIAVLLRNKEEIVKTQLKSLKRFDKDVKVVEEGFECGIGLKDFDDIKEGDIIETYKIVEKKRTL